MHRLFTIRVLFGPLVLLVTLLMSAQALAQPRTLTYNKAINVNQRYSVGLLELALSYFPGKYDIQATADFYEQAKQFREFEIGNIDVTWAGTEADLERRYRPIRIPLFKGLLGNRLFIIRRGNQARFDRVETLEDLSRIPLGQGRTWADTEILRANGLNVVTTNKYVNLFPMLEGGRFDAFPRGAHEPWSEIREWSHLNLTVEKSLLLVYRMPLYFFVMKDNQELGDDLEEGLNRAIADGRFDEYFFNSSLVRDVLKQAHLQERKVFMLNNPKMTKETPVDREELWLDISSLDREFEN